MVEDDEVKILRPERVCSVCFFTLKRFVADALRSPSAPSEEPLIADTSVEASLRSTLGRTTR